MPTLNLEWYGAEGSAHEKDKDGRAGVAVADAYVCEVVTLFG